MQKIESFSGTNPAAGRGLRLGLVAADSKPPGDRSNEDIPLAFGYFASILREQMPECDVIVGLTADELIAEGVDVIGISSTTEEFEQAKKMAASVKEQAGLPVMIGGVHISVLPRNLTADMDVGVMGEGEVTLVELLRSFASRGKRFAPEDLRKIPGIAFRENGSLMTTPARPLIRDLDRLPPPDRRKIWIAKPSDRAFMFTSRGCRYRCTFCASSRFWGSLRTFSPEYVVREIEHVHHDLGLHEVHFFDDLFITPLRRLRDICRLVEEAGLQREMSFSGAVRADLVSDELCEILNRMNFHSVMFGLESFSGKVLDYLKCGTLGPEDNQRALDVLHKHGIQAYVHMIYGSPVETTEDLETTFRALEENLAGGKIHNAGRGTLRPYPGTPVWDEAMRRGLVSENMNWDALRPYPGTAGWEYARAKGYVSEDRNWERVRAFAGPYLGAIPEDEYHRLLLEHEERTIARVPENEALWVEWGIGRRRVVDTLAARRPERLSSFLDFSREHLDVQLGEGWYALEGPDGGRFRWMGQTSTTYLKGSPGADRLSIRGLSFPEKLDGEGLVLEASINGQLLDRVAVLESSFDLMLQIPAHMNTSGILELALVSSRAFTAPPDIRRLSVAITGIGLAGGPVEPAGLLGTAAPEHRAGRVPSAT